MLEVKSKPLIDSGIVVYQPPMFDNNTSYINLDIYYSVADPRLTWTQCNNGLTKIYSSQQLVQTNGNLFIYDNSLKAGFYSIKVRSFSLGDSELSGDLIVGFRKEPTEPLVIGLPYSIYPTISLI